MADIIAAAVGGLNTELTVILNATAIATRRLPSGHPAAHLLRQAEAATRRSAQKASKLLAFAQWSGVNQPHVSGDGGGI